MARPGPDSSTGDGDRRKTKGSTNKIIISTLDEPNPQPSSSHLRRLRKDFDHVLDYVEATGAKWIPVEVFDKLRLSFNELSTKLDADDARKQYVSPLYWNPAVKSGPQVTDIISPMDFTNDDVVTLSEEDFCDLTEMDWLKQGFRGPNRHLQRFCGQRRSISA